MDCPRCEQIRNECGWALVGAAASVGIERNKSTAEMIDLYFQSKHNAHAALCQLVDG